jgi:hypothetical protein
MTPPFHTLYCDETGSTGNRLLDPAQPTFAERSWFMDHESTDVARDAVVQIEKRHRPGTTELKGANLVKSSHGQRMVREVCEALGKNGGVPYAYVVEKLYSVCGTIVDTFFDPQYNSAVSYEETWDPQKRQADAQLFYENSRPLVEEFAEAYRIKDPAAVKVNAEHWVTQLRKTGFAEVAQKVSGVLPTVEDEVRTEAQHLGATDAPPGVDSLNFPIVMAVFQFVEQNSPYPCHIVHDQTAAFEPIYRYFFDRFKNAGPSAIEMKDGRQMRFGFRNALSLSFVDSRTEPLVRAADYVLAGSRRFVQLALHDAEIPPDITHVAFSTLGTMLLRASTHMYPSLEPMPELSGFMGSNGWMRKIFRRLASELRAVMGSG